VKLYSAISSRSVHFNMLDARDHARLKQQFVNANTGEVVARDETVRGYEYARGQFVVMTDDELAALQTKSDRTIEIEEFVPIEKVDPIYFEKSQLLGPDKGGAKAYRLLAESMRGMGRVAIGRFSTRGRQQLVLLRPRDGGLVLHGLFYADEVRDFADIDVGGETRVKPGEIALANQLIEQLSNDEFEPRKYEDEYRRAVLAAVDAKVAGEQIVAPPAAEPQDKIIDLVAALKQSLAARQGPGEPRGRKPAKAKGRRAAAAKGKSASG
jgi:DNA end-binding protein Ku